MDVVLPGTPATPSWYVAGDPINLLPLVNMAADVASRARARDDVAGSGIAFPDDCNQALVAGLRARGATVESRVQAHGRIVGKPQLLSSSEIASASAARFVVDWVINDYGFSGSVAGPIRPTMLVTLRISSLPGGNAIYHRRFHYRPRFLVKQPGDGEVDPVAGAASWATAAEFERHIPQAVTALNDVCKAIVAAALDDLS